MANVMIRKEEDYLTFYIPKKDVETKVVAIEFDLSDCWGGNFILADGSQYYIEPLVAEPKLPITLRARRA